MPELYIDGDACPVKDEVLKVAARHGAVVHLVSNRWHRGIVDPRVHQVVVPPAPDAADNWIAEHIVSGDIAVTADIPLAARCIAKGAAVVAPTGRTWDADSIGMALATRNLMTQLRETGEITGGPASFRRQDRSRFLATLESLIQALSKRR